MRIFFSLIFILFLASCADIQKKEQFATIQELQTTLDSIQEKLNSSKIDSIQEMLLATNGTELRIKNNYVSDTIDMEFGRKMDAHKIMRKKIPIVGKEQVKLFNAIEEEKKTLKTLINDIENGSGERDKYDEHIAFESEKVKQISSLFDSYIHLRQAVLKDYQKYHPELYAYSLELVEKRKNEK